MTTHNDEILAKLAQEAEYAEETRDVELNWQRKRPVRQAVYGLRLPTQRIDQLRELANQRGVEPSAMVRGWIEAHLDSAANNEQAERHIWERELRETTQRLQQLLEHQP